MSTPIFRITLEALLKENGYTLGHSSECSGLRICNWESSGEKAINSKDIQ